jgi:hypothetical protein
MKLAAELRDLELAEALRLKMEKQSVGSFLAQGAVGDVFALYVLAIIVVLYQPNPYNIFLIVVLPVYLFAAGILGTVIGGVIWLAKRILKRSPGMLTRAALGSLLATLTVVIFRLCIEFIVDLRLLEESIVAGLILGLPASLLAGSRFHPLRMILFRSNRGTSRDYIDSGFSFSAGLLLRVASLLGLLEALLYFACLAPFSSHRWVGSEGEALAAPIVAILYLTVSFVVSFTAPRKYLLLAVALVSNTLPAIWSFDPHRETNADSEFLIIVVWVFIGLWVLFVMGRVMLPDNKEDLPAQDDGNQNSSRVVDGR